MHSVLKFPAVPMMDMTGGFSGADRETLTTIKVQLGYAIDSINQAMQRITRLEETRLTARDLEELMADTDTLRKEKQELADKVEARLTALERWQWKAAGAAMAVGAIAGYVAKFIGK